jgi:RNA polymerase sigma factor (TIGR02999 family)
MSAEPGEVTALLRRAHSGDAAAREQLAALVYDELRRIARRYMQQERAGHTLQATGLVHEAYLKLIDDRHHTWANRAHFIGTAAHAMRRILVDHARRFGALKRGRGQAVATLNEAIEIASADQAEELLALDEALERLEVLDQRQSQIVEMRYFGGLTIAETAEVLGVSVETVKKEWASARAWLFGQLSGSNTA